MHFKGSNVICKALENPTMGSCKCALIRNRKYLCFRPTNIYSKTEYF